jgi:hypothetical protein
MKNRRDRMPNISVNDVLERVQRWRDAAPGTWRNANAGS